VIIEIDKDSGFCFGVENSIQLAEKELAKGGKIYCLGEIVHNEEENRRLEALGVEFVDLTQFKQLKNVKVFLRAHGEPPSTYAIARANNIKLIDTTCAIVKQLQYKIICSYEEMLQRGGQIVVFGMKDHPEVIGLIGQTSGQAKVVSSLQDLDAIDFRKPVTLFSQTTKSEAEYHHLEKEIKHRLSENGLNAAEAFTGKKTICKQVTKRGPLLERFAKKFDMVIFVTGKQSSNGKVLSETCKSVNSNTYVISSVGELEKPWFEDIESIGITGATSTPRWMLEQIAVEVRKMND
jgi:4-hydroxy-3-methylbut-2-enyl diphosphate reductase